MASKWPYNTLHWRQVRPHILARDGGRCRVNLPGCTGAATEVHHIVAPPAGHPFDPTNLQASCKSCNVAERNIRRAEWARRYAGEGSADLEVVRSW